MYRAVLPALTALALASCVGNISDPGAGGGDDDDDDDDTVVASCEGEPRPGPTPRLTRLTHLQYDRAVSELLDLDAKPSTAFLADPEFAGYNNNAAALVTSDRQARDYRRAAETLAEQASAADHIDGLLPCDAADGATCAQQFIESFGRRVYRRPLSAEKVQDYLAVFDSAADKFDAGSTFERGIRMVVEAMLQSPAFLYRVELSKVANDDDMIPLDGYELASRLSFTLWDSIPDDTLLDAAAAGELDTEEGIQTQAARMLDDARATGPIDDFHFQWLQMRRYAGLSKDPEQYPDFDADTGAAMQRETQEFLRHLILEDGGDFKELLTSNVTYVNASLARTYGIEGEFSEDVFTRVELDPAQRAGILTQLGFLTANAYLDHGSPIHRGVFVQRRVLCAILPDPPGDIDTTLPPQTGDLNTTRKQIEQHTSADACQGCHSIINPPGFSFEHFDAVGGWRDDENGVELDTTGTLYVGATPLEFDGAVDLVGQLSETDEARRCYVSQWFRYSFGRKETEADACTIDELDTAFAGGQNIREMLINMTRTKAFRFRAEEVSQ